MGPKFFILYEENLSSTPHEATEIAPAFVFKLVFHHHIWKREQRHADKFPQFQRKEQKAKRNLDETNKRYELSVWIVHAQMMHLPEGAQVPCILR